MDPNYYMHKTYSCPSTPARLWRVVIRFCGTDTQSEPLTQAEVLRHTADLMDHGMPYKVIPA